MCKCCNVNVSITTAARLMGAIHLRCQCMDSSAVVIELVKETILLTDGVGFLQFSITYIHLHRNLTREM